MKTPILITAFFTILLSVPTWGADEPASSDVANGTEANTDSASADMAGTTALDRAEPDPESQRLNSIAEQQDAETEVIWLETVQESRLALYQQTGNGQSHGAILLIHDQATSPDWPSLIHPIRNDLTEHGWNTLAINIPDYAPRKIPTRTAPSLQSKAQVQEGVELETEATATTAASDQTQDTVEENIETIDNYMETFARIVDAGNTFLNQKGHTKQVVIAVGDAAIWATQYIIQTQPTPDRYLILINPSLGGNQSSPALLPLIAQLKTPTLDLYFNGEVQQQEYARLRKRMALRSKISEYRQIKINQRSDDPKKQQQWLSRKLWGLLNTHVVKTPSETQQAEPVMPAQISPGS